MYNYLNTCMCMYINSHMHTYIYMGTQGTYTYLHIYTYMYMCTRNTGVHTHTNTPVHGYLGTLAYAFNFIQIYTLGYSLDLYAYKIHVPIYAPIHAHRLHVHEPTHVHVNTPSDFDLFTKAPEPYHFPILSWGIIHISDKRMGY